MEKQLYHISDELQSLIDWEKIMPMPREAGGHNEQMKGLFKGATVIAHWNEGDWQGTVATCVKLPDGRFLVYNDYYGSCYGCDAWDGAMDNDVKKLCIDLANSAYIFDSLEDVVTFLSQEKFDSYEWGECAKPLLERINVWCFICSLERIGFKQKKDSFSYLYQQSPFLFELEFNEDNPHAIKVHVYIDLKEPNATIESAMPQWSLTNLKDSSTIEFVTGLFNKVLSHLCEVTQKNFRQEATKTSLGAKRNAMIQHERK